MEEGQRGSLYLEWKFEGEEGRVNLPEGREVVLGRGTPAAVKDVRASRRQVAVVARGGVVRVRALGLNPALVVPDTFLLRQDAAPAVLPVGGTLCLLCDRTYPFTLRCAPAPPPVTARWQWRADDGWCDYAAPVAARLEAARRRGAPRVDIDGERFVDLPAWLQRRKDDPSKRREVRRTPLAPPTALVSHQSSSANSANTSNRPRVVSAVAAPPPKVARRTTDQTATLDSLFTGAPAAPAAPVATATEKQKRVVWYWRADDGSWTPYSDALSRKIENVFANPEGDETRVVVDKLRYVDLVVMKQRHHINDDLERDIKREVL